MNKKIYTLIAMLCLVGTVSALDLGDFGLAFTLPGATMIEVNEGYTKTFSIDTSDVQYDSCTYNYNEGLCDYVYKCYIVIPSNCDDISCAIDYECWDITDTMTNPETLTVNYQSGMSDVNKVYGVVVFIAKTHMTYDWDNKEWTESTGIIESTKMADKIEIQGIPQPEQPDIMNRLNAIINDIISGIHEFLCSSVGIFC